MCDIPLEQNFVLSRSGSGGGSLAVCRQSRRRIACRAPAVPADLHPPGWRLWCPPRELWLPGRPSPPLVRAACSLSFDLRKKDKRQSALSLTVWVRDGGKTELSLTGWVRDGGKTGLSLTGWVRDKGTRVSERVRGKMWEGKVSGGGTWRRTGRRGSRCRRRPGDCSRRCRSPCPRLHRRSGGPARGVTPSSWRRGHRC